MITNHAIGQRISTIAVLFLLCTLLFAQNDDSPIVPDVIEVRLFPALQKSGEMIFQN